MTEPEELEFIEKREFVRLVSSLPIEFNFIGNEGQVVPGIDCQCGFTSNVSKTGLCLESECMDEKTLQYLNRENILVEVFIKASPQKKIRCVGEVKWFHKADEMTEGKYLIGLHFMTIAKEDLKFILSQAKSHTKILGLLALALGLFFIGFLLYFFVF